MVRRTSGRVFLDHGHSHGSQLRCLDIQAHCDRLPTSDSHGHQGEEVVVDCCIQDITTTTITITPTTTTTTTIRECAKNALGRGVGGGPGS